MNSLRRKKVACTLFAFCFVASIAFSQSASSQNTSKKDVSTKQTTNSGKQKANSLLFGTGFGPQKDISLFGSNPLINSPEDLERYAEAGEYWKQANELLKQHKPDAAIASFKQAIEIYPALTAGQQIGEAYAMKGQWQDAITWYRKDIYPHEAGQYEGGAWRCPGPMLKYALLLLKTGQTAEAITIYNASLSNINSIATDSGPSRGSTLEARGPVLLPSWDVSTMGSDPKALEAMVHVGLSTPPAGSDDTLAEADAAIKLMPDLAIAHYFRAEALSGLGPSKSEAAAAAYRKAAQLGDAAVMTAAQAALKRPQFKSLPSTPAN